MKLRRYAFVFVPILLAAACVAPNTALDIAANDRIYKDVPFRTRAPGDRELFIAPLTDGRSANDMPAHDGGFPITYGTDQVWDRPVREMLDEVLARQLRVSGLFSSVVERVKADTLVLVPTLEKFTAGAVESASGCRSFAEVALRLQVYGPVDAAGDRDILFDKTFSERQMTPPSFKPISPYLLVGNALRIAMQKTLAGLDSSNVGRTYMPAELAGPGR